MNLRTNSQHPC